MDAVYILGGGSLAEDEEILYSARSLCENMMDLRNVYVIGEYPKHLPLAAHYQEPDRHKERWKNTFDKVIRACNIDDISDEFLLMNDDFFMLEPFNGADFPFYAVKGSNGGPCGANSFGIHAPIRISKEMFSKMPFTTGQNACKSWRSFYANFYGAPPKFVQDCIIRTGHNVASFDQQTAGQPFFSISDAAMLDLEFSDWLRARFNTCCLLE